MSHFTVIQSLDVFIRREYKDILLESLKYCQKKKGLEVWAYVIMSSHAHMILGRHGEPSLEGIIRDIKKFTSLEIIKAIKANQEESRRELFLWLFERAGRKNINNKQYQFWQQSNHSYDPAGTRRTGSCFERSSTLEQILRFEEKALAYNENDWISLWDAIELDSTNIAHKLNLAEALVMANTPGDVETVFTKVKDPAAYSQGDWAIMIFLKYVAALELKDAGRQNRAQDWKTRLDEIIARRAKIVDSWDYSMFDKWKTGYTGASKGDIDQVREEMKKITEGDDS